MHEAFLCQQIDEIVPNGFESLEKVEEWNDDVAANVLSVVTGFACQAQNDAAISAGRRAARIPRGWLRTHLHAIVEQSLDLSDEWEYRRLIELLTGAMPDAVSYYIGLGIMSPDPEVVQAAEDFSRLIG